MKKITIFILMIYMRWGGESQKHLPNTPRIKWFTEEYTVTKRVCCRTRLVVYGSRLI